MRPPYATDSHPPSFAPLLIPSAGKGLLSRFLLARGAGPHPVAIFLHGFPGNDENFDLAHSLRRSGWNVLLFHYRGAWGTAGEFSLTHMREDVSAVVEFTSSALARDSYRCDPGRLIIVGHSMGGFAALHAAARHEQVIAVAALASFNVGAFGKLLIRDPALQGAARAMMQEGCAPLAGAHGEGLLREMMDHAEEWDLESLAGTRLRGIPILLAYGARDGISEPELHHHSVLRALAVGRAFPVTEHCFVDDHYFSDSREELARVLAGWAAQWRGNLAAPNLMGLCIP